MPMLPKSAGRWLGRLLDAAPSPLWRSVLRHLAGSGPFSATGIEIGRELPRERVLVLAPHPDDEIIGPGGALVQYAGNGSEVTVVYVTDGGGPEGGGAGGDRETLIRTRRREAEAVGRMFGFEQIFWSHPDTRLDPAAAERDLRQLMSRLRPDSVYLTSYFEHHYDHYATNALLARALEATEGEPRVCGYEVWDNLPSPNWVVDISKQLERKIEAMATYATPMIYTDFAELIRHRGALHYLLHVDPRRTPSEGTAEAFLRLSSADFLRRFEQWDALLRASGSDLTARLDNR